VCRLLLIADLLAESPTSSDPNIRSGLLSGGHARTVRSFFQYTAVARKESTEASFGIVVEPSQNP
jgi:hypothetical protein